MQDVTRWPTTLDLVIEHKGCVLPDALMQHAGCSRTKRKGQEGSGDVRSIRSNPQISEVARKRQRELREKASGPGHCLGDPDKLSSNYI